jgi:hypothetical protein
MPASIWRFTIRCGACWFALTERNAKLLLSCRRCMQTDRAGHIVSTWSTKLMHRRRAVQNPNAVPEAPGYRQPLRLLSKSFVISNMFRIRTNERNRTAIVLGCSMISGSVAQFCRFNSSFANRFSLESHMWRFCCSFFFFFFFLCFFLRTAIRLR